MDLLYRLFGFLLGSTLAGAGVYYYVLDEYKVSNGLLSEDIYVRLYILVLHLTHTVEDLPEVAADLDWVAGTLTMNYS